MARAIGRTCDVALSGLPAPQAAYQLNGPSARGLVLLGAHEFNSATAQTGGTGEIGRSARSIGEKRIADCARHFGDVEPELENWFAVHRFWLDPADVPASVKAAVEADRREQFVDRDDLLIVERERSSRGVRTWLCSAMFD
jgi:hypothetical protein